MTQDNFLDIILPLQPTMQLVAERLLHSAADAEDMVQEVVVELWEKRDRMQHVKQLDAYAMQSLKNHCFTLLTRRKELTVEDMGIFSHLNDEEIAAEVALNEERAAQLDSLLEQLPEKQRRAIEMKYIEQLSHEEMQKKLGMSSMNVYTTLSRALSAMKQMIRR